MSKLPQISGKELGRVLTRLGFVFMSQRGSHMKFTRSVAGRKDIIVIPNHKIIRKGTLLNILKRLNLGIEKLRELR
ncbi:MAG: type II toxin-antitoxin system HicA family toxin [Candidatus Sungiibacteriota bacterium]